MVARVVRIFDVDQIIRWGFFPLDVLADNFAIDHDQVVVVFRDDALPHVDPLDVLKFLFVSRL